MEKKKIKYFIRVMETRKCFRQLDDYRPDAKRCSIYSFDFSKQNRERFTVARVYPLLRPIRLTNVHFRIRHKNNFEFNSL